MFDTKKETLDEVARVVLIGVVRTLAEPVRAWRNNGRHAHPLNARNQDVSIVGLVRHHRFRMQPAERGGLVAIMWLACGHCPARHQAQSLDQRMNLGGQSVVRAAQRLCAVFLGRRRHAGGL